MNQFFLLRYSHLLLAMSKNELKSRFSGNYGGILWAFLQPLGTIGVLWFVFSFGFRTAPVSGHPFALWLSIGMVGWFFLSEAISVMTHSIISQSFLIKKVVFNSYLIPLSALLSTFILHLVFIGILGLGCIAFGYYPNVYWFGMLYYLFCGFMLCLGIGYFTSSVAVFFPDIGQIVGVLLQFGFWLTPIFWSLNILPQHYAVFFELNPASYIIQGYRDSLLDGVWFWEKLYLGGMFWAICLSMIIIGLVVFNKLKNSFADVL